MCANFKPVRPELASFLDLFPPTFAYKEEVYPGNNCPILINQDNQMQWREALFGLVPPWAKDTRIARQTYNSRAETVQQKPSFRHAWHNNQFALVPVELFYEPRYVTDKPERWAIERQDKQPFTIAAIYETSQQADQLVRSMSMLTINADQHPLMKQFHAPQKEKRSIVVIPPDLRQDWLTANYQTAKELLLELQGADYATYPAPR
ncbi:SOS response-associated peptidase [Alkanindiges sp. WGS2144]|uniref:SOS response-associated peptidase n=1 Tax=Alkanindiges sp. WGS2144 TaxID=3366808 RepID=UPI00375332C2